VIFRFLSDLDHLRYYVRDLLGLVLLNFSSMVMEVVFSAVVFFFPSIGFLRQSHFPKGFLRDII